MLYSPRKNARISIPTWMKRWRAQIPSAEVVTSTRLDKRRRKSSKKIKKTMLLLAMMKKKVE